VPASSPVVPSRLRRGVLTGSALLVLLGGLPGCDVLSATGQAGGPPTGVLDDAAAEEAIATAPPDSALAALGEVSVAAGRRAPATSARSSATAGSTPTATAATPATTCWPAT
jgi:hypothetical protein